MAVTAPRAAEPIPSGRGSSRFSLWNRTLDHYPDTGPRVFYLAIVVLATIILYYELYVAGAVGPQIIAQYHMSFRYFVYISVVSNAVGAFSSVIAGLADRWGRANLVVWGLLLTGLLVAFAVPHAGSAFVFAALVALVGFVEGMILVATPALVRDFSPQLGRASAMGFWTLGPVVGSLVLSEVASHTLPHLHAWQDQYMICGFAGLGVFLVALFGLRELSPNLRDQLMVSARDRARIDAPAKGIDVEDTLRHPWRQMLHFDIVGSAFAVSVFLLIYYAAVGFFVVYFTTTFGFTEAQANGIGNWFWGFDALALVLVGLASDRLRVRKPFMIVGGLGAAVMTIVFLSRTHDPHTGYYTFAWIITVLAVFLAIAYAPWMASFTETVERRNPALTATGLAVWGWILRIVVAVSFLILPIVVSAATPLVTYGPEAQAIAAKYPQQIQTLSTVDPATLQALAKNPLDTAALAKATTELHAALGTTPSQAITRLLALKKVPAADIAFLQAHGAQLTAAQKKNPGQWQTWWWVCVAGELVFLPLVLVMAGRWSPAKAKRDAEEHERQVEEEMARLREAGVA